MPINICPHCGERYMVGFDTTDYVHECNSGNDTIDQEDVVVTGNWEDYDGSGTRPPQEVLMQGAENKFWGTKAGIEGYDKEDLTRRGARASTHRQRPHLEFINIKRNKNDKRD